VLDVVVRGLFVFVFMLLTGALAVALDRIHALPAWLERFLRGVAGNGPIIAEGRHVLGVVVFASVVGAIVLTEISDVITTFPRVDAMLALIQIGAEAAWACYLTIRALRTRQNA